MNDVNPAKVTSDPPDDSRHLIGLGHISAVREPTAPGRQALRRDLFPFIAAQVDSRDARTLRRDPQRARPAHPVRAARYHDRLAAESPHPRPRAYPGSATLSSARPRSSRLAKRGATRRTTRPSTYTSATPATDTQATAGACVVSP